jgi:hypothetical protein
MIDRRNRTRHILNAVAHRVLQSEGEVADTGVRTVDGREFCVGDEVVARRPARELHPPGAPRAYVRNGSRGRVVAVSQVAGESTLSVEFASLGCIEVPGWFVEAHADRRGRVAPGLDYAYALTSYAVQGATLPASTSAVTAGARRRELYVNLTRGRHDNHLFVAAPSDSLSGEGHLPRPPEDDVVAEVLAAVGRPDEDRSALEIDPHALAVAETRSGHTAAELRKLLEATHRQDERASAVLMRAEHVAVTAAARAALAEPPPWTAALLPDRPVVPWLAAHWDAALGAVAAYRARWEPTSLAGTSVHARVLGVPTSQTQATERSDALWRIGDVWAGVAGRLLAERARSNEELAPRVGTMSATPPPWMRQHLRELGAAGWFSTGAPTEALAHLYAAIAEFRERWGRETDDASRGLRSLLGDRPDEPLGRRQWDVLAGRVSELTRERTARARVR